MREITRDPSILDGRWHFAGTAIPVANVRLDYVSAPPHEQQAYRFPELSPDEAKQALAFEFPPVRTTEVDVQYAAIVVHCECGEATQQASSWPITIIDCVCNREWRVAVAIEPVPPGTKAAESKKVAGPDGAHGIG